MSDRYCPYCMTKITGKFCPKCGLTPESYKPASRHLPCGTLLAGRYYIGRVIGEGGFGITYLGFDVILERKVAIKEYFPSALANRYCEQSFNIICGTSSRESYDKGKDRFIREARAMAKMNKQKEIADVEDFFEKNGTAYIVMEYVDGITLKTKIQNQGVMLPNELFELMYPIMDALQAMHDTGLIHRDISPDNIMIEKGRLRLIDFGCARENTSGEETMTVMHKQGFSPAEQYQRKGQGPWTDVYALAATMYYCITGKVPPQAVDRLMEDTLIKPTKMGVNISTEQEDALLTGMAVRKEDRFQSASALKNALASAAGYSLNLTETAEAAKTAAVMGATEAVNRTASFEGTEIPGQAPAPEQAKPQEQTAKTAPDSEETSLQDRAASDAEFDNIGKTESAPDAGYAGNTGGAAYSGGGENISETEEGPEFSSGGPAESEIEAGEQNLPGPEGEAQDKKKKKLPKSIWIVIAAAAAIVIALIIVLVLMPDGKETQVEEAAAVTTAAETEAQTTQWSYDDGVLTISGSGAMDDYEEETAPWYSYAEEIETIVIEGGITSIGDFSFYNCTNLSFVSIASTVTEIGKYAFSYCENLEELTLPEGIMSISNCAFFYCKSLVSINLPEGLTSLNIDTFAYCTSLESVTIPDTVTGIGSDCFFCCYSLTEITIPENVRTIGEKAFSFCTGMESINVDSGNAYYVSVDGVLFTADLEMLVAYPGGNKDNTEYDIPDSVTEIKAGAFEGNLWLETVNVPAGTAEIGENAFCCGWNLEKISVDSDNADYSSKKGVLFDKKKTELIAYPAAKSGTSYEIPDTVQVICDYAFYYNQNLEEIIIPESLTEIGDYCFDLSESLADLNYVGSEDEWNKITVSERSDLSGYSISYNYVAEEETEADASSSSQSASSDSSDSSGSSSSTTSTTAAAEETTTEEETTPVITTVYTYSNGITVHSGTKYGSYESESYGMIFDGDTGTKWCVQNFTGASVIWEMPEAVAITGYTITTAADCSLYPERNPVYWTLYGSNADEVPGYGVDEWTRIESAYGTDTLGKCSTDCKTFTFTLSSTAPEYKYYKLTINSVKSGKIMQFSEFALIY